MTFNCVPHEQFLDIFSYSPFLDVNNWKNYSASQ